MNRARKTDKRGRSTGSLGSFIAIERYVLNSTAWLHLKPLARAAYLELAAGYNGANNGKIAFSSRNMAIRLGVGKATASRAFAELEEHGFIETARRSSFTFKLKLAAEYRLTAFKCDTTGALASKTFARWAPKIQNTVSPAIPHGSTSETVAQKRRRKCALQYHQWNREGTKATSHGITRGPLLYSSHVVTASDTLRHGGAGAPTGSAVARTATAPVSPTFLAGDPSHELPSLGELSHIVPSDMQSWAATEDHGVNDALARFRDAMVRKSDSKPNAALARLGGSINRSGQSPQQNAAKIKETASL